MKVIGKMDIVPNPLSTRKLHTEVALQTGGLCETTEQSALAACSMGKCRIIRSQINLSARRFIPNLRGQQHTLHVMILDLQSFHLPRSSHSHRTPLVTATKCAVTSRLDG